MDRLEWWEKIPLALATTAQSVVVGLWYYRNIDLGWQPYNVAIAIIAGLALDAIVVTTVMGRRVGRDSRWSAAASFGAFLCSALIAVDSYSDWLTFFRPLLHISYPAMVLLYSQHLATVRKAGERSAVTVPVQEEIRASAPLSKTAQVKQLALSSGQSESTIWRKVRTGELSLNGKEEHQL